MNFFPVKCGKQDATEDELRNRVSLFTLIIGIKYPLVVGFNKDDEISVFNPSNVGEYRPPESDYERSQVPAFVADVIRDLVICDDGLKNEVLEDFGMIPVPEDLVRKIDRRPNLYNLIGQTTWLVGSPMIKECKFCGHSFVAENVRAKYCQNKACQAERNKIKQRKFKKNQKRKMKIQK